ncbi:AAA family ATPase [Budviciaceae bacterium BWR-B9]|uniref:AAA family ATPase n=1 Tax=Limnobaculum allomyrinae TaxID=2791986 RepID=A0ABS1IP33_9GAMM|nr:MULTISPECIES: AAA family ATPase [Limnobaculum]MBK5143503.1 AAA family ATPase [Limnobaculum allomyrinae]MBV7691391.1 AAA family ATPase [Limnobaculum sp. M2-1]
MKIVSFTGKGVYEFLDFNITFNQDMNFLVGGNGSGKTTALMLINALTSPNIKDLCLTEFENITLTLENSQSKISISCYEVKNENNIKEKRLRVNKVSKLTISPPKITIDDSLEINLPKVPKDYDFSENEFESKFTNKIFESYLIENNDSDVLTIIRSLPKFIFLGLERRAFLYDNYFDNAYNERSRYIHHSKRKPISGNLGVSLMEAELLVQESYRRARNIEARYIEKLKDNILTSAFRYIPFHENITLHTHGEAIEEKGILLDREQEIRDALSKLGVENKALQTNIENFFKNLRELFNKKGTIDNTLFNIELLINSNQIAFIEELVKIIDSHKEKIDKLFFDMQNFTKTLNGFYSETKKSLSLDTVGHMEISKPNGSKTSIEALSSGERQLLIIFASVFFNKNKSSAPVFIIDEPELSLHLRWQLMLTKLLNESNNSVQFILATHSPEIIGDLKDKSIKCR